MSRIYIQRGTQSRNARKEIHVLVAASEENSRLEIAQSAPPPQRWWPCLKLVRDAAHADVGHITRAQSIDERRSEKIDAE
jgi:hypothetical protein